MKLPGDGERRPGQTKRGHLLTFALGGADQKLRARAVAVLSKALVHTEGRLDRLAELLGCAYRTAQRCVKDAGLQDLSNKLRWEHGHNGPSGRGIAPWGQRRVGRGAKKATKPAK